MVNAMIFDQAKRLRSYEIVAEIFGENNTAVGNNEISRHQRENYEKGNDEKKENFKHR